MKDGGGGGTHSNYSRYHEETQILDDVESMLVRQNEGAHSNCSGDHEEKQILEEYGCWSDACSSE